MKSRSRSISKIGSMASSGASCSSAPRQKTRPITAACCSNRFSPGGRRSIRAAINACTLSGIPFGTPSPSASRSIRAVSSRKSGLPSARSSTSARCFGVSPAGSSSSASCGALDDRTAGRARSRRRAGCRRPTKAGPRAARTGSRRRSVPGRRAGSAPGARSRRASARPPTARLRRRGRAAASPPAAPPSAAPPSLVSVPAVMSSAAPSTPSATPSRSATASLSQQSTELLERFRGWVDIGDACRRLDHRGDRPERDALAVRERAAREHGRALDAGGELFDEPRLADAWVAEHRDEGGAAVAHRAVVRVVQQLELLLAPHEAGTRPALSGPRGSAPPATTTPARRAESPPSRCLRPRPTRPSVAEHQGRA